MSRHLTLILPAGVRLNNLRQLLTPRFALNPKTEGLGELEELQIGEFNSACASVVVGWPARLRKGRLLEMLSAKTCDGRVWNAYPVAAYKWDTAMNVVAVIGSRWEAWIFADSGELDRVA